MQREAKEAPARGRQGRYAEIGALVVDFLMAGVGNPCEGILELLGGDNLDDAIVLVRAKLRARSAKVERDVTGS